MKNLHENTFDRFLSEGLVQMQGRRLSWKKVAHNDQEMEYAPVKLKNGKKAQAFAWKKGGEGLYRVDYNKKEYGPFRAMSIHIAKEAVLDELFDGIDEKDFK